jgi:hypothetical protein
VQSGFGPLAPRCPKRSVLLAALERGAVFRVRERLFPVKAAVACTVECRRVQKHRKVAPKLPRPSVDAGNDCVCLKRRDALAQKRVKKVVLYNPMTRARAPARSRVKMGEVGGARFQRLSGRVDRMGALRHRMPAPRAPARDRRGMHPPTRLGQCLRHQPGAWPWNAVPNDRCFVRSDSPDSLHRCRLKPAVCREGVAVAAVEDGGCQTL